MGWGHEVMCHSLVWYGMCAASGVLLGLLKKELDLTGTIRKKRGLAPKEVLDSINEGSGEGSL